MKISTYFTEKSDSSKAKTLAKISCKIGDHFVNAYINTGSSISVASTELYRKLVDDECSFKEGKGTLKLMDDSIPDQVYRITTTTVKVIGKTKLINLVAFPEVFTQNTTLGIDFLKENRRKSKETEVFRVPEKPAPKSKPVCAEVMEDPNEPLLDWIFNPKNLKKPLYNILADGTAEDDDLFAICAFMKRLPRMVSPIGRLEKPSSNIKRVDASEDRQKNVDFTLSSTSTISAATSTTSTKMSSTSILD